MFSHDAAHMIKKWPDLQMPCWIILHRAVQCPGAFDREDGRYTRTCWNDQGHVGPTPTKTLLDHFTENAQGNVIEGKGQFYSDIA